MRHHCSKPVQNRLFSHFLRAAISGDVPLCANTFRRAPHPMWVLMAHTFVTKKILTSPDTPNPRYAQLSQLKKATFPLRRKGVRPFNYMFTGVVVWGHYLVQADKIWVGCTHIAQAEIFSKYLPGILVNF